MVRAFIAVDPPQEARDALARAIDRLQMGGVSGVRWVKPEAIHLTLKFLGEVDPALFDKVSGAMERAAQGMLPFTLALSEIGAFPSHVNPRVIWVGLTGGLESLRELHRRIDQEMYSTGDFPREDRPFTPHLTLGRMRERVPAEERRQAGKAIAGVDLETDVSWQVGEVNLIQSTLTSSGAVYHLLRSCKL